MNSIDYPYLDFCKKMTELWFIITERYTKENNEFYRYDQLISEENTKLPEWMFVRPSIAELLNELPKSLVRKSKADTWTYSIYISHDDVEYTVSYQNIYFTQWTLPNALAEMWIWLKQNDYLTK